MGWLATQQFMHDLGSTHSRNFVVIEDISVVVVKEVSAQFQPILRLSQLFTSMRIFLPEHHNQFCCEFIVLVTLGKHNRNIMQHLPTIVIDTSSP